MGCVETNSNTRLENYVTVVYLLPAGQQHPRNRAYVCMAMDIVETRRKSAPGLQRRVAKHACIAKRSWCRDKSKSTPSWQTSITNQTHALGKYIMGEKVFLEEQYLHANRIGEELDDERDAKVRHRQVLQHQLAVARPEAISEIRQIL